MLACAYIRNEGGAAVDAVIRKRCDKLDGISRNQIRRAVSNPGLARGLALSRYLLVAPALAFALPVAAQIRPLNDTGQLSCHDATSAAGTVAPAMPDPETVGFNRQDCTTGASAADVLGALVKRGESSTRGRDYTKISNAGGELPPSAELGFDPDTWNCTRDNVTGLVWEVKWRLDSSLFDGRHLYSWFDTNSNVNGGNNGAAGSGVTCTGLALCNTTAYRNAVNALAGSERLCGRTDWRLPNAFELESLLDYGVTGGPIIDTVWFPGSSAEQFWSGDNDPSSSGAPNAWALSFNNGLLGKFTKSTPFRVRLVRDDP